MIEVKISRIDPDGTRHAVTSFTFSDSLFEQANNEPEPLTKFQKAYLMLKEGKSDSEIIEAGVYPKTLTLAKQYLPSDNDEKEEGKYTSKTAPKKTARGKLDDELKGEGTQAIVRKNLDDNSRPK